MPGFSPRNVYPLTDCANSIVPLRSSGNEIPPPANLPLSVKQHPPMKCEENSTLTLFQVQISFAVFPDSKVDSGKIKKKKTKVFRNFDSCPITERNVCVCLREFSTDSLFSLENSRVTYRKNISASMFVSFLFFFFLIFFPFVEYAVIYRSRFVESSWYTHEQLNNSVAVLIFIYIQRVYCQRGKKERLPNREMSRKPTRMYVSV